nr:MAG TPA: hypothetical protein [Caudoviricetes sp.]
MLRPSRNLIDSNPCNSLAMLCNSSVDECRISFSFLCYNRFDLLCLGCDAWSPRQLLVDESSDVNHRFGLQIKKCSISRSIHTM